MPYAARSVSYSDVCRCICLRRPGKRRAGRCELSIDIGSAPRSDEVLIRTEYSGVSRGTEALVFHGRVPPTEMQRMRAPFQRGDFPAPVKYGYASVGIVESGPADLIGRRVFALYPHQDRYVVPVRADARARVRGSVVRIRLNRLLIVVDALAYAVFRPFVPEEYSEKIGLVRARI